MDPLTQSLLGAAAAQALFGRRLGPVAALIGAVAGELPDVDVFFTWADPALPHEYHRHFTHSLVLIPAGAALAALPFLAFRRLRARWTAVLGAALAACATHGLLDTCTSYGTYLLWPFVNRRLAWDVVSIIDPLFTATLLVAVAWAVIARSMRPARVGLALGVLYLGLGAVQHARARSVQTDLAAARGHEMDRRRVMPTIGNILVWRSVYESGGRLHADAVRVGLGAPRVRRGGSVAVAAVADTAPGAERSARVREVYDGLYAFADGFVALVGDRPGVVGDMRYSLATAGFEPLWGIQVTTGNPHPTVRWVHMGVERRGALRDLRLDVFDAERFADEAPRP